MIPVLLEAMQWRGEEIGKEQRDKVKYDGHGSTPTSLASSENLPLTLTIHFQPFAFESRDFLRRGLVGKVVRFRVLYKVPTSNREYGLITLQNGAQLPDQAVAEGWLKLREDAGKREESEETQELLSKLAALEARAKAESKGVWSDSSSAGRIETVSELPDAKEFAEEHKGKQLDGWFLSFSPSSFVSSEMRKREHMADPSCSNR